MEEHNFYKRQKVLKEIGEVGQKRLSDSSVLIVGAGGLGNPVATYLAGSGVGRIGICDFDNVEVSNLHRQVLFTPDDVGRYKADVLKERVVAQNPFVTVDAVTEKITHENGKNLFSNYDIIVDCCDNFDTKFLLHDLSYILRKDLIQSSIYQYEGQLQVFKYSERNNLYDGCLRCLWPKTPQKHCVNNCSVAGVVGAVAGVFGSLQAMETIKAVLGIDGLKHRQMMIFDLLSLDSHKITWKHNKECSFCSHEKSIDELHLEVEDFELTCLPEHEQYVLVDIREEVETKERPISRKNEANPMSKFNVELIDEDKEIILVCTSGFRSYNLAKKLRESGYKNIYSYRNGVGEIL